MFYLRMYYPGNVTATQMHNKINQININALANRSLKYENEVEISFFF